MNKKDVFSTGFETGYDIAQNNIVDLNPIHWNNDDIEIFISEIIGFEQDIYRQYSPFESFAHEINESRNNESLWESYDNGVSKGIMKRVREWKKENRKGYHKNKQ